VSDGYTFRHAARMEWVKLRHLRSFWWTLAGGMAATIVLGTIAAHGTRATGDAASSTLEGFIVGQLITGVLGVLVMTSEYSTGLVRVTFAAIPRRGLVLLAKALVTGGVFLAVGEAAMLASFVLGTAALRHGVPHPSLGSAGVLRAVLLTGAYLALTGLLGLGTGVVIRHGAAAVSTLVGGLFIAPVIVAAVAHGAGRYMPELIAGNSLTSVKQPVTGYSSPWLELWIVAAYPAAALVAGAWLLITQDAA
jgi:ABC-2 type transport system permease protein